LRNSAMPFFVSTRYLTSPFLKRFPDKHMRFQHLNRLASVYEYIQEAPPIYAMAVSPEDTLSANNLIVRLIGDRARYVVVAPGAADGGKRWGADGFAELCEGLAQNYSLRIVFVGDQNESVVADEVISKMRSPAVNLCGQTSLTQMAVVLKKSCLAVGNDSASMHMASYLEIPTIVIFGPTNPKHYGPTCRQHLIVEKKSSCLACQKIEGEKEHSCLKEVKAEEILNAITIKDEEVLLRPSKNSFRPDPNRQGGKFLAKYQNILVVRTDRIGDVVLTMPAVHALRKNFPSAKMTLLVTPLTRDLVLGHPDIDEVLFDNRNDSSHGLFGFWRLIFEIRRHHFDLVLNFHTKRRTNLLCFLAGIPVRYGYKNNNYGFLLNHPVADDRPQGYKHEAQYCLDMLKDLGVDTQELKTFIPVQANHQEWVQRFLAEQAIDPSSRLVAVHPGASCPTKKWPVKSFGQLMQNMRKKYSCQFAVVGSQDEQTRVAELKAMLPFKVVDLSGKTSVGQLAAFFEHCQLLVSNDSGPVHVAAALGIPVVSIFTRNQPGINPQRWRPLGDRSSCVAPPLDLSLSFAEGEIHDPGFLENVTVEQVMAAVDDVFKLC
jgi:heptosyltransferase II